MKKEREFPTKGTELVLNCVNRAEMKEKPSFVGKEGDVLGKKG